MFHDDCKKLILPSLPENLFITLSFILTLYMEYMYDLVHLPPLMLVFSLNKKWPLDLSSMLRTTHIPNHSLKVQLSFHWHLWSNFFACSLCNIFCKDFSLFPLMKPGLLICIIDKKIFKLNFVMMPIFTYHLLVLLWSNVNLWQNSQKCGMNSQMQTSNSKGIS